VVIGALLLARNLGYSIPIWGPLVRYWPVLIIAWGCLKLVDYYRLRNDPERRPIFTGGEVVMLIFVIFLGTAITAAANISPNVGRFFDFDSNFDFWDITGSTYAYNEHHELEAKPGSTIRIFNLYGTIDIKPAESDTIVLDVEKIVRAANKDEADARSHDFTFSIKDEGGTYRVGSNRDENVFGQGDIRIGNERQRYKSNLTLRVPQKASLDVTNKYGPITLSGVDGTQTINNKYGPTSVRDVTGALTLNTGFGAVVIENITEAVRVTNRYASTTLRKIGGNVDVDNQFGSIDVQDVNGSASIQNRYSVINAQRIAGNLTIQGRNNSVDVDDTGGTLDVETSYKNVSVRNAKGNITLSNRHGGVDIEFEQPPSHEIRIAGSYTAVTLELPSSSAFFLDARTEYGEIESEFDSVAVSSSGRNRSARGQQGNGGPRITIETQHGNVHIERRG
jgi:DUF4097 and DUF4098 domain-containing protein YvlB